MITRKSEQNTSVRPQMRGGKGEARLTALTSELPANTRLFSKIVLAPGCSIGYHTHENETELFYFASGSGFVMDDDQKIAVTAGDALSTGNGHGHAVENDGQEDLVILAAIVTA